MSFPILTVGGYGTGILGDVDNRAAAGPINSYARVTEIDSMTVTIDTDNALLSIFTKFVVGSEVIFHVSAAVSADHKAYLGKWMIGRITEVNENVLTLNVDITKVLPVEELKYYHCQLIAVPQFRNLTINSNFQISPPPFYDTLYYGGIVALKCSDTLTFNGGHINLVDRGIAPEQKDMRPLFEQEQNGTLDTDRYAGWENSITKDRFLLNAGDGAAWIVAKNIICHEDSRIGNVATYGSQFCRGASDSVGTKPSGVTNIGGSTLLIAAESFTDFNVKMFAKYRSSSLGAGQGLCRCYIATNDKLRNDEGLYAYDVIHTPSRITNMLNIKHFGKASFGDIIEPTIQLNNYAQITEINGTEITYANKTSFGLAPLTIGALVMIHANHKDSTNVEHSGRFFLAKVLQDTGSVLTLNALPNEFFDATVTPETYAMQIVSIPQADNFKLTGSYTATPTFDGNIGGILALAVKNHCDLSGGKLNVEGKGGGNAYGANGMQYISNSGMSDRLPIGQGHGSVFILAKELTVNASTRIGATYSGANFGGVGASANVEGYGIPGGYTSTYKGYTQEPGSGNLVAYQYYMASTASGANAGGDQSNRTGGGYGSNSVAGDCQGAHVLIIVNTINNYVQDAVSTGGSGGTKGVSSMAHQTAFDRRVNSGGNGGSGYGGGGCSLFLARDISSSKWYHQVYAGSGGAYNGGGGSGNDYDGVYSSGGGGSGWCFIYCNNAVNQTAE